MLDALIELEDYVARYLPGIGAFADPLEMTRDELFARFRHAVDMVRRENGKPAAGEFDPTQEFR